MFAVSRRRPFALAWLSIVAACGPRSTQPTEFVFRVPDGAQCTAAELAQIAGVVEQRLKPFAPRGVAVTGQGDTLFVVRLGFTPTTVEHTAILARVERAGGLGFLPVADADTPGFDLPDESKRAEAWRSAHPGGTAADFERVPREQGGPVTGLRWIAKQGDAKSWMACDVRGQDSAATRFDERDFGRLDPCADYAGRPAFRFEFSAIRDRAFGQFTKSLSDRQIAIVVEDEVVSAPVVHGALRGPLTIEGRWSAEERDALLDVLRSGRLPFRPVFVEEHAAAK